MADRHQFRANWHDYNDGIYFVTVCCAGKAHLLGKIRHGEMLLSECGAELQRWIDNLAKTGKFEIINHVIMPNHFHLLVRTRFCASPPSNTNLGCLKPPTHGDATADFHHNTALAIFIGNLKGGIVRYANRHGIYFKWQQRYHEHIVRHPRALATIMNYIDTNISNWPTDCFNANPQNPNDTGDAGDTNIQ